MISWKHHAYIIEGDVQSADKVLGRLIEVYTNSSAQSGIVNSKATPELSLEVRNFSYNSCGIKEARELVAAGISSAFNGQKERLMFIAAQSITIEAQNALLKFFEEPNLGLKIVLLIPNGYPILPTLRSRSESVVWSGSYLTTADGEIKTYSDVSSENTEKNTEKITQSLSIIKTFYSVMSLKERIQFVDDLAQAASDEKKTKSDVAEFLKILEVSLEEEIRENVHGAVRASRANNTNGAEKTLGQVNTKKINRRAQAVLTAETYIFDQSCSLKILLERVAMA